MTPFAHNDIGSHNSEPNIFFYTLIFLICFSIYGYKSGELGIYADDAGFLLAISKDMSATNLLNNALGYVTGRNLHIVWHYLLTVLAGGNSLSNIETMHHIAVFFDAINACLIYALFRTLGLLKISCFIGAIFFILFPNHGETHFWISALPMNIISTSFVLILLIICSYLALHKKSIPHKYEALYLIFAFLFFFLALFTYDQTAPISLFSICITIWILAKERKFQRISLLALTFFISLLMICSWLIWKFTNPGGGPSISLVNINQIFINFIQSITIWISTFYSASNFFNINAKFASNQMIPLWYLLDAYEKLISVAVVAVILLSSMRLIWTSQSNKIKLNYSTRVSTRALLVLSAAMIILAYVPSYAWYISPRHNYLPSVGVTLFLISCVDKILQSNSTFLKASTTIALCYLGICFTVSVQIDKQYWIKSYSYRKILYNEIASKFNANHADNLVFLNFSKKPYPNIPDFLIQAPTAEIYFITNRKLDVSSTYFLGAANSTAINLDSLKLTGVTVMVNCFERLPPLGCADKNKGE